MKERLNRWTMVATYDDEELNTIVKRETIVGLELPEALKQLQKWIDQSVPEDGDNHPDFTIRLYLD